MFVCASKTMLGLMARETIWKFIMLLLEVKSATVTFRRAFLDFFLEENSSTLIQYDSTRCPLCLRYY